MNQKKTCFVVSPIGEEGSDVRKSADDFLELLVEPALQPFDFTVVRADKIASPTAITADMIQLVQTADLCIINLTDLNPNVFYECGRRHETGKPSLQLISKGQRLPFDVAGIRTIVYDLSDPRSTLASVREIQRFVAQISADEYREAASGQSLASLSEILRRIERKLNELGSTAPAAAATQLKLDVLRKHPIQAFKEAIERGDILLAVQLLPRIRTLIDDSSAVRCAVICAQAGEPSAEALLRDVLANNESLSEEDVLQCVFGIKDYYFNRNQNQEGIQVLEQVVKRLEARVTLRPAALASAINLLQMLYYADNEFERSIQLLSRCRELAPNEAAYACNLAQTLESSGRLEDAALALDDALRLDPAYQPALEVAVKLYPLVGRQADAERARSELSRFV